MHVSVNKLKNHRIQTSLVIQGLRIRFWSFLCHLILCLVEFAPRYVFSQDLQDQVISGQETKTIIPFPSGFEWKLLIKSGKAPREDAGEDPSWGFKESHIWNGKHLYCVKFTCILRESRQWEHHHCLNSSRVFYGRNGMFGCGRFLTRDPFAQW